MVLTQKDGQIYRVFKNQKEIIKKAFKIEKGKLRHLGSYLDLKNKMALSLCQSKI